MRATVKHFDRSISTALTLKVEESTDGKKLTSLISGYYRDKNISSAIAFVEESPGLILATVFL